MTESVLLFGASRGLAGIVTEPPHGYSDARLPAVVFLNSGLVHRVGPNRMWVRSARRLAARGFVTLRFDLSGIGDSRHAGDTASVEERWVADVRAAMDAVARTHDCERFILVGNCSGAALAFAAAAADSRVVGAGLINPPGRRLLRYHLRLALASRAAWLRLLDGRAKIPGPASLLRRKLRGRAPARRQAVTPDGLRLLAQRGVDMLLASCDGDHSYDFFHHRHGAALTAPELNQRIRLAVIAGANHDFIMLPHQERMIDVMEQWAAELRQERWRSLHQVTP